MSSTSNGIVFGGELAVGGVLLMNAMGSALAALMSETNVERILNVAIALWMGTLACLLPGGRPLWHVATLVTTIVGCIFSLLAVASGLKIAVLPAFGFGAAAIYLAFTVKRKRAVHGI
jgi:hypothetical protein